MGAEKPQGPAGRDNPRTGDGPRTGSSVDSTGGLVGVYDRPEDADRPRAKIVAWSIAGSVAVAAIIAALAYWY